MDGYRGLGASIAMDGFGLGCSNLDRVARLRPDVVKIDRVLLAKAVGGERFRRMLPGMIELLHESNTKVAIEGIESRSEALFAIESKADFLQGFFFAKPQAGLGEAPGARRLDEFLDPSRLAAA